MDKSGPRNATKCYVGPKHAPPFEFRSESIWTIKTLALCLDQKKFEKCGKNWLRKFKKGKIGAVALHKQFTIYTNVTKALRMADTPAEPQTGLRW